MYLVVGLFYIVVRPSGVEDVAIRLLYANYSDGTQNYGEHQKKKNIYSSLNEHFKQKLDFKHILVLSILKNINPELRRRHFVVVKDGANAQLYRERKGRERDRERERERDEIVIVEVENTEHKEHKE